MKIIATKLINRKAVKNLILQFCEDRKGWECTRVSQKALDNIEDNNEQSS